MDMWISRENWRKEQIRCFDSEPLFSKKEMKEFETEAEYLDALDKKTIEMMDDSAAKIEGYLSKAKAELRKLDWAKKFSTSVPKTFKVSKGDQLKRVVNQDLEKHDGLYQVLDKASRRICGVRESIENYHDKEKTVVYMKDRDRDKREELSELEKLATSYKGHEYMPKELAEKGHYEWLSKGAAEQQCRKCPICGEWVDKELDCCSNGHLIDDRTFKIDIAREIETVPNFYQVLSNKIMGNAKRKFDPHRIYFFETLHSPRGFLSEDMCEPPFGYGLRVDKENEKLEFIFFELPYPYSKKEEIRVFKDGSIYEKHCNIFPMFTIEKGWLKIDLRCPIWKLDDNVQEYGLYHFFMTLEDVLGEDGKKIWMVVTDISEQLEVITYQAQFEDWYDEWNNEWEERGKGFETRYDILARENGEYRVWPSALPEEERYRLWDMKDWESRNGYFGYEDEEDWGCEGCECCFGKGCFGAGCEDEEDWEDEWGWEDDCEDSWGNED